MDKVDELLIFVKEKQRGAKTSANNTYLYDARRRTELRREAKHYGELAIVLEAITPGKRLKLIQQMNEMEE